jgi:hypothetical protein
MMIFPFAHEGDVVEKALDRGCPKMAKSRDEPRRTVPTGFPTFRESGGIHWVGYGPSVNRKQLKSV